MLLYHTFLCQTIFYHAKAKADTNTNTKTGTKSDTNFNTNASYEYTTVILFLIRLNTHSALPTVVLYNRLRQSRSPRLYLDAY